VTGEHLDLLWDVPQAASEVPREEFHDVHLSIK
jgi:hypothetical protein